MRLLILCSAAALCLAQPPRPPQETLVSPEVHADRRVTFRIRAPKASEVTMRGEWMTAPAPEKLAKDEAGVWSLTVGPLTPDIYYYLFLVDGVPVLDQRGSYLKTGVRGAENLVEVRGGMPHEVRDVPHGAVQMQWYKSKATGGTRRVHVYTPPGYDSDPKRRYPVLYLLHGMGDIDAEWVQVGRANVIVDNLIADGKAAPMIVVMPNGHLAPDGEREKNTQMFEEDLMESVIPLVEAKYRTAAGADNRAIAGLSMGGGQSLYVGLRNSARFGAIGIFSMGLMSGAAPFEKDHAKALAKADDFNSRVKLFWIGCGERDFLYKSALVLDETLKKHGIRHVFRSTEGEHAWNVWRKYLAEIVPMLFRPASS
jgi:enterochelin esterase family protein